MSRPRSKGLGRGLGAVFGQNSGATANEPEGSSEPYATLPLDRLQPGRFQPRTQMDEGAIQALADSIRSHGLMQPIVVRPVGPSRWEIIAGERRFRAAGVAGLTEVSVIVRDVPDSEALQLALIENIQRENLNPLEEAQALRRLIDEFDFSHEQAADAIGRSRSATSNLLRLLNLAPSVQTMLLAGDIDMGHARALLALDGATQIMLAQQAVSARLSVREVEKLVQRALAQADEAQTDAQRKRAGSGGSNSADIERLERRLADALAAPVSIRTGARGAGRLTIAFGSLDQFQGLLNKLGLEDEDG